MQPSPPPREIAASRLARALDRLETAAAEERARGQRLEQAAMSAVARIDRLLAEPEPADG